MQKNKALIYIPLWNGRLWNRKDFYLDYGIANTCSMGIWQYYKKPIKNQLSTVTYTLEVVYSMSPITKRLSLRVPANLIYRGLKDTRLEQHFPEFFTGVTRKLTISNNKANSELQLYNNLWFSNTNQRDFQIESIA